MKRNAWEKTVYKTTWMGEAFCVPFHIDDLDEAMKWCTENVSDGDWHITRYVSEYEHKLHFKFGLDAKKFPSKLDID